MLFVSNISILVFFFLRRITFLPNIIPILSAWCWCWECELLCNFRRIVISTVKSDRKLKTLFVQSLSVLLGAAEDSLSWSKWRSYRKCGSAVKTGQDISAVQENMLLLPCFWGWLWGSIWLVGLVSLFFLRNVSRTLRRINFYLYAKLLLSSNSFNMM